MEVATQNVSFGISRLMVWLKAFVQLLHTIKMYCACGVLGAVHDMRSGMLLCIYACGENSYFMGFHFP